MENRFSVWLSMLEYLSLVGGGVSAVCFVAALFFAPWDRDKIKLLLILASTHAACLLVFIKI